VHKNLLNLFAVIAVAAPLVACGKSNPIAPSNPTSVTYSLSGSVSGPGDSGAVPLEGVNVSASDGTNELTTTTDANGMFSFSNVAAGDWTLHFTKTGYIDETTQVTLASDMSANYSLNPDPAAAQRQPLARARRK
jgi:hypothetical protein